MNGNPSLPWWQQTTVYQVYPRSFADGNGDGLGDLAGVIGKLDYLVDLGVETLWLSPFYTSPQADFGYDISDYRNVAPEYGSHDTVRRLLDEAHERGLKVVFDMVLNHTSDQHPWFLESRSSRDNPKRDWYVWRPGRKPGGAAPPNNWHAMIGGSGWHYDEVTDEWYWAQFLPFQPDLNYRNPAVREEMLETLRFWLRAGVDGFRLDIVNALFEDAGFRDNPFAWTLAPSDEDPTMLFQGSKHTLNHPDTLSFMKELRRVMSEFDTPERFLVGEVNAPLPLARAHCGDDDGLHLVFLFKSLSVPLQAPAMRRLMAEYEALFPAPLMPTWVFSNHDRIRRISRLGDDVARAKLNAAWQLTVRGVPFIYYGEEVGMTQQRIPRRNAQDPIAHRFPLPQLAVDGLRRFAHESINRDECRTPMQWSREPHAGFCAAGVTPWLPVPAETAGRSVAEQRGDEDSLLECYRRFLAVRSKVEPLRTGSLELLPLEATGPQVVGYRRVALGTEVDEAGCEGGDGGDVLVLLNASPRVQALPVVREDMRVLASTHAQRSRTSPVVELEPWEGIVLRDAPQSSTR